MDECGVVWFRRCSAGRSKGVRICRRAIAGEEMAKPGKRVPTEGTARSERKERERGELENPLMVTDLTLHLAFTPPSPAQVIAVFT